MEQWIEEELRSQAHGPRPPRRRVAVGLVFPVVAGAAAGICLPVSPLWFLAAGAGLLLPLFLWIRRPGSVTPLMAAFGLLMAAHARLATGGLSAAALPALVPRPLEYIQFVAMVLDDAVARPARPGQPPDAVFSARLEGLNREGTWQRVDGRIRVVLRGGEPAARRPRYGERWRFRGVVRPAVPRRTGLFTLPENQAVIDPDRAVFLDAGRGHPVKAWCLRQRRKCRVILGRGLEDFPDQRGLLQALLLGYREDLPKALRQDFAATGTVHIFAISGAHVGMVALICTVFLRALRLPLTRWFLFLAPLLAVYILMTGAATSAIRAGVMAILLLAAPLLKRRPDAISALALAAIAILLAAPGQLGDLGFLLSFSAVAGLLALQPLLDFHVVRWFRRDEWQLPAEERPAGRRLHEGGLAVARFGLASLAAWMATSPLTAFFFNLFSPVALAMNLLVIPTAFAILLAGVMSLLTAPAGAILPEVFNHAARACAAFLEVCIRWAADVPGGHWFVRPPPAGGVAAWYAVLAVTVVMARRVRPALPAGLALLAALALGWGAREATRCRVAVLDVGEGSATLVQARRARMLVDAGPAFAAENTLRRLRAEGVNRLEALILTHADAQHIGAARDVLRAVPVRELWLPAVVWPSPLLRDILRAAEEDGISVRRLHAGDTGDWPGSLFWEVLWPPADLRLAAADDGALVLRVARFGVSVILAGDLGGAQEPALIGTGRSPAGAVLVVGRHGDRTATSAAWLAAVRPREALISSGPHAAGRHPDEETLAQLAAGHIRVWRTDQQGTLHVDLAGRIARWPEPGYRIRPAN